MKLLLAKLMYQAQTTVAVKNTLSLALILARVLLKGNLVRTARLGRRRCENFRRKFTGFRKRNLNCSKSYKQLAKMKARQQRFRWKVPTGLLKWLCQKLNPKTSAKKLATTLRVQISTGPRSKKKASRQMMETKRRKLIPQIMCS